MNQNNDDEKIFITGVGAITPIGGNLASIYQNLYKGVSGVGFLHDSVFETLSVRHAGIVKDDYFYETKLNFWRKFKNRSVAMLFYAAEQAIRMSGDLSIYSSDRKSCILGCEPSSPFLFDEMHNTVQYYDDSIKLIDWSMATNKRIAYTNNDLIESGVFPHLVLAKLLHFIQASGSSYLNLATCAASSQSIGEAFNLLKSHETDVVISGGWSSKLDPISIARLIRVGALAETDRKAELISRPFDKNRNGFTIGEGAIVFVLERKKTALERGATPLAELAGYGASLDGYSITDPREDGYGMILAIQRSLKSASIDSNSIDYINAHGTSTKKNDVAETNAINHVFGSNHNNEYSLSSTKSSHGHLISAAGAMESLVSILSIRNNFVPPTINYTNHDPECYLNYTPNKSVDKQVNVVLSNSFGLGGQNSCLIFKKVS